MSMTEQRTSVDMKLEVVTIPVSDVDRATAFYNTLGWRQDVTPPGVVQFTPPGSWCSIQFGPGHTSPHRRLIAISTGVAAPRPATAPSRDPSPAITPDWLSDKPRRIRGEAPTEASVDRSARPSAAARPVPMPAAPRVMTAAAAMTMSSSASR